MSNSPENPQAFPGEQQSQVRQEIHEGMTLRDYFIAHAPIEPQPWFTPVMSPKPALPDPDKELSVEDAKEWRKLDEFAAEEGNVRVKAYCDMRSAAYDAREAWENERKKQCYVQWPAAWADAMLAERAKA